MTMTTADGNEGTGPHADPSQEEAATRRSSTRSAVKGQPSPRLPHERDESSDSGTSEPREIMKQAAADLDNGMVATDRSVQTDELYARTLRGPEDLAAPASAPVPALREPR